MSGDDYDAADLADLRAAYELLDGIAIIDEKGLPRAGYLEPESEREAEARKALARLLRNGKPLDGLIRHLLAGLFDPSPFEYVTKSERSEIKQSATAARQLIFKSPRGRRTENRLRFKLAIEVSELVSVHGKVEAAIVEIADRYNISPATVWDAWEQYKDDYRIPTIGKSHI
jgi:hypothetical protein